MKYCSKCGAPQNDEANFCSNCGNGFANNHIDEHQKTAKKRGSILNRVYKYLGSEKNPNMNWRFLFSDIFKKHSNEDAEKIFICGTKLTTPDPTTIPTDFPRPWLYSRIFLGLSITFFLLWICCSAFENRNSLPGTIVVGSFIVPISTLMMFFEMNVWRNVSFYTVMKLFMIGGCASLVATLILFTIIPFGGLDYVEAFLTGLIEEVGKAIIVYLYMKRKRNPTILNGLLYGACVGAGFAAFESAGYAFRNYIEYGFDRMLNVIYLRGFLAPGGHVAWAAITGAAMAMASKTMKVFSLSKLSTNVQFPRLFFLPIIMHSLWDSPLAYMILPEVFGFHIALIVCVWFVLLVLVNIGLKEIK